MRNKGAFEWVIKERKTNQSGIVRKKQSRVKNQPKIKNGCSMYNRKTKKKGPLENFKKGRICKKYLCKQRLSIYNPEEYCHVHRGQALG